MIQDAHNFICVQMSIVPETAHFISIVALDELPRMVREIEDGEKYWEHSTFREYWVMIVYPNEKYEPNYAEIITILRSYMQVVKKSEVELLKSQDFEDFYNLLG